MTDAASRPNKKPKRTTAKVKGSGAVAQGKKAKAVGERGMLVEGDAGNINTGTQVLNLYLSQGGLQRDQQTLERQVASYLGWVRDHYGRIALRGIERGGRKVLELELDQTYASLEARITMPAEERAGFMGLIGRLPKQRKSSEAVEEAGRISQDIDLDDVLALGNRLVITGAPGCGKTTVLLHIAWALAKAILDGSDLANDKLGLDRPLPLPIFIPLAAYARHVRDLRNKPGVSAREGTLSAFISHYLIHNDADFDLPDDFFVQLLRDGRSVIVLLDGLDEVANEDERAVVRQAVESLVHGRTDMRVLVTCRTAAYRGQTALGGDFRDATVRSLDTDRVREIVRKFYGFVYAGEPKQADRDTDELLRGVEQLEAQRKRRGGADAPLISTPLMVRLLLIVHYSYRHMPEQRAELFMKAAQTMIQLDYLPDVGVQQSLKQAVGNGWTDQYEMAQHLAFYMHSRGEGQGREIEEDDLRAAFTGTPYAPWAEALIGYTRNRGGLLEERLGAYRFMHLGFQEFLSARYLVEERGVDAAIAFLADGRLSDSWWREVALLIPGYCVADTKSSKARAFLRRLIELQPEDPALKLAAAELAGAAALEWSDCDASLRVAIAERIESLFEDSDVMIASRPRLRVDAGVVLGRLGDPRDEVQQVDALRLCLVPAGPFIMGSSKEDKQAYDDEYFDQPHDVPYAYAIGQHPITNAQFNEFVSDGGYAHADWWKVASADGAWQDGKVRRRVLFYEDEANKKVGERFEEADASRDFGLPFNLPNHPVVGITWYEALAFTEWLTARWRSRGWLGASQRVHLPNEPEWEKAARGGQAMPEQPIVVSPAMFARQTAPMLTANPLPRRRFAFGDAALATHMNYAETKIESTSAAGAFPSGISPYGCHDLCGNAWEWTCSNWGPWLVKDGKYSATLDHPYPYANDDGRENTSAGIHIAHVVRGGAFVHDERDARCAFRAWVPPDDRVNYLGFRVVVSPISLYPSGR